MSILIDLVHYPLSALLSLSLILSFSLSISGEVKRRNRGVVGQLVASQMMGNGECWASGTFCFQLLLSVDNRLLSKYDSPIMRYHILILLKEAFIRYETVHM